VISNYPGWLAELIAEHQCGIAVAPRDVPALADAMTFLADNRQAAREKGARARQLAESLFDRSHLAARFVDMVTMEARLRRVPLPRLKR